MLDKSLDLGVADKLGLPDTPITHAAPPADKPKSNARGLDRGKAGASGLTGNAAGDSGVRKIGVQKPVIKKNKEVGVLPAANYHGDPDTILKLVDSKVTSGPIKGGAFDGNYKSKPFHKQMSDEGYP